MKETKRNILLAALDLFNKKGFVNVRLQHIADEANVSIGNLAYHYATKKDLLHGIYHDLVNKQTELLNDLNIVPLFENLDMHWDNVAEIQHKYTFFYLDTLEVIRFDDAIRSEYRNHIKWEKDQLTRLIEFNISRGALNPMERSEIFRKAEQMWLMENSWLHYSAVTGQESPDTAQFKDHMWLSLSPLFSPTGRQEYDQLIRNKKIPL